MSATRDVIISVGLVLLVRIASLYNFYFIWLAADVIIVGL
jgi:hypothetical protein